MPTFADKPTIEGDRILLRPMVASDAEHMWADTHDDEITYFTGSQGEFARDKIEEWSASRADQPDRLDLAVADKATGEWLGEVVINDWDAHNRSCNFRIALSANARNRGIGTAATQLIVDYVFDHIDDPPVNRISLDVFDFNPRGLAVYEKVGFLPEGVMREALFWKGEFHDSIIMSVLRRDREPLTRAAS